MCQHQKQGSDCLIESDNEHIMHLDKYKNTQV